MSKRPIPILKKEDELENFIQMIEENKDKKQNNKQDSKQEIKNSNKQDNKKILQHADENAVVKKSLILSEQIDNLLRFESAKTRKTQNEIIEEALKLYFK